MTTKRQTAISKELNALLPFIPYFDSEPIKAAASSPHMRTLTPATALWLATIAYIRHQYTNYDELRDEGYDKDAARFFVLDATNEKLTEWHATRLLTSSETVD